MSDQRATDGPAADATRNGCDLETRTRIVDSAVRLFYLKGVGSTTLDDVRKASGTSESQLYNHFPDKMALIHAVIDVQSQTVLAREEDRLGGVKTFPDYEAGATRSSSPTRCTTDPTDALSARCPPSCRTRTNGRAQHWPGLSETGSSSSSKR
ncbi:hypothetical protein GCM10009789_11920 [Kribbella sancticallisti]|uniref:HTH tetR-type domain-containing protein n=1 Tax=Kribbella sancticallisti TaxID=460087 RepID=A0ABP4NGX0_9ACTN